MRILIVDDSPLAQERLVALIARHQTMNIVGAAATGREAIEMVRALRPDAVLLDLRLPDRSGLDVLRTVKEEHPEVAVILLSLYARPEVRMHCLKAGADAFLDKLTELTELPDVLRTLTKEKGSR